MTDRVVVITGASSGIGAALAEHLSNDSNKVVLVARREEALRAVAAHCAGETLIVVADVTNRADVATAVSESIGRFGRIDVWVNNAGRGMSRMPSELTDQDIDEMITVNVKSVMYGAQEVLPHFKQRGEGHIINVSSMLGRLPLAPIRSAYCGAKHFVNSFTDNLRLELQATHPGIQVSLVSPGVVRTDFGLNAKHGGPDSRQFPNSQSAEEVAGVIAGVIESRLPDVYTRAGAHDMVLNHFKAAGTDP